MSIARRMARVDAESTKSYGTKTAAPTGSRPGVSRARQPPAKALAETAYEPPVRPRRAGTAPKTAYKLRHRRSPASKRRRHKEPIPNTLSPEKCGPLNHPGTLRWRLFAIFDILRSARVPFHLPVITADQFDRVRQHHGRSGSLDPVAVEEFRGPSRDTISGDTISMSCSTPWPSRFATMLPGPRTHRRPSVAACAAPSARAENSSGLAEPSSPNQWRSAATACSGASASLSDDNALDCPSRSISALIPEAVATDL